MRPFDHNLFFLRTRVRTYQDFPKLGVKFLDLAPLLFESCARHIIKEWFKREYRDRIDIVVGIEARGFPFGMLAAEALGVPFVLCRKKGKLPGQTTSIVYNLEYGSAEIEMQNGAIEEGASVLIVDDVLATGGTAAAAADLVGQLGGALVYCAFVAELESLEGRKKLGVPTKSILRYY